ncbi:uncharacterized protein LOC125026968 [Penaeus chinensis]|uniref:uncharacterized protein LOC125026968 n=1 Tax=Penaeus chinensis TaxID=139456 RepID=UPI001FB5DB49|nr:uncharacterized protein LOC125026968 [Penaeus chinensis]
MPSTKEDVLLRRAVSLPASVYFPDSHGQNLSRLRAARGGTDRVCRGQEPHIPRNQAGLRLRLHLLPRHLRPRLRQRQEDVPESVQPGGGQMLEPAAETRGAGSVSR